MFDHVALELLMHLDELDGQFPACRRKLEQMCAPVGVRRPPGIPEIRRHLLCRAAFRLTQNRADAEELFQETCIRAFSRRESSWEATASPLGWLMRVQYNLFTDETRKRRASVVVPIADMEYPNPNAGGDFDPEACASEAQQFALIYHAWRQLKRTSAP